MASQPQGDNDEKELEDLTNRLKTGLEIKDRKYLLTNYPKCFVGSDAVTFMSKQGIAPTRVEAVNLGKLLLAANIIRHVTKDHDFKDENKFYRFTADEPSHGSKEKKAGTNEDWSWSDFIPGKCSDKQKERKYTLQPATHPLNADVQSAVDAVELAPKDTFGITPMDKYNQELLDNVHPVKWVPPQPQPKYNLVAIGAGAAGLVSAAGTAGLGGRVAIIEEHMFGGDCLNFGCVPSKAILRSAKVAYDVIVRAQEFGLEIEGGGGKLVMNFEKVMERVRRIRSEISHHDACQRFTNVYNMDVYIGHATFVSPDTVKVGEHELKFARCVIATGAKASVPPIAGLADVRYLTNQTVWNLTTRPARLAVIGAGPIGCELAQAFALLGCEVTLFNRSAQILGKEDRDAADVVQASMQRCGVRFVTGIEFVRVGYKDAAVGHASGIVVSIKRQAAAAAKEEEEKAAEESLEFDEVLVATGRKPNVEGLNLEVANVAYDTRAGIQVNDYLQTTNGNIYSAGDCCTRFQFTHMADAMARIVIRNAMFFAHSKVSDLLIPWCTYTFPEIAHVGLYESDLEERKLEYDVIKVDLSNNDRAICDGESENKGFIKVLIKKNTDQIFGATIVSENAGDQISEYTLAMQANVGLGFLDSVIHPYPTVAEGIKHSGGAFRKTMLTPITKALLRKVLAARR